MTWDNIHLDHIKPVSKFNLNDHEEFLQCCNYTNFQPLLSEDNLSKSDKWSDEDILTKAKSFLTLFIFCPCIQFFTLLIHFLFFYKYIFYFL